MKYTEYVYIFMYNSFKVEVEVSHVLTSN